MQVFLQLTTHTFSELSAKHFKNFSDIMQTFNLILEHKVTGKMQFITVEECIDVDDCINHVTATEPDFQIEKIELVQ